MKKEILAGELAILLRQLPPDYRVACNDVRNLAISDTHGRYVGYVNFLLKTVDRWDQESAPPEIDK